MSLPSLETCRQVFAQGLAFTRSFAHPYLASRSGRAWRLHDDHARSDRRRNDEWILPSSLDLEKIDGRARESAGRKYLLSVVEPAGLRDPKLKAKFTGLGYRLWRTEALMARSTLNLPQVEVDAEIRLVETQSLATQLAAAAGSRMLLPEHLGNPSSPVRCYVAMRADHIAGWARSISIGEYGWCASMFVAPESRRRGYGRALVAAVLRGDRAAGLKGSILAASHTGAKLYAAVDYATIGTVHVLVPAKK